MYLQVTCFNLGDIPKIINDCQCAAAAAVCVYLKTLLQTLQK